MLNPVSEKIDATQTDRLERLKALLRLESISTDPAYDAACREAAQWCADDLADIGFSARVMEVSRPGGKPMVYGEWLKAPGQPTVLFYGHYDVQPADPLELWDSAPFDPVVKDGKIIARGASDDKGQLMTFVEACRAHMAVSGSLPVNVKVLLEGEEESGGKSMAGFLEENRDLLGADIVLICDTGLFGQDTPAIVTRLRGMVYREVTIKAASRDLHSGMYGGLATNPINLLARILGGMTDGTGRVQLDGFYDDVAEPDPATAESWKNLEFSEADFLGEIGLSVPSGEDGRTGLEKIWSRPTLDVNGIIGGYTAAGSKTVIAAEASAKVSMRLVASQKADKVIKAFDSFVTSRLPADCTAEFIDHGSKEAFLVDVNNPFLKPAQDALTAVWGKPAALVGCGGSIPVGGEFKDILDLDSLFIGFGRDDDAIHSPNEKYDLDCFNLGTKSWASILTAFART